MLLNGFELANYGGTNIFFILIRNFNVIFVMIIVFGPNGYQSMIDKI